MYGFFNEKLRYIFKNGVNINMVHSFQDTAQGSYLAECISFDLQVD